MAQRSKALTLSSAPELALEVRVARSPLSSGLAFSLLLAMGLVATGLITFLLYTIAPLLGGLALLAGLSQVWKTLRSALTIRDRDAVSMTVKKGDYTVFLLAYQPSSARWEVWVEEEDFPYTCATYPHDFIFQEIEPLLEEPLTAVLAANEMRCVLESIHAPSLTGGLKLKLDAIPV